MLCSGEIEEKTVHALGIMQKSGKAGCLMFNGFQDGTRDIFAKGSTTWEPIPCNLPAIRANKKDRAYQWGSGPGRATGRSGN